MLIYYWKMPVLYHNLKWFYISYKKRIEIQETDFTLCTQGTKNSLNLKVIFPIILQKTTEVVERFPWSIHELQARIIELNFALNFTKSVRATDFIKARIRTHSVCPEAPSSSACGEEKGNEIAQSHHTRFWRASLQTRCTSDLPQQPGWQDRKECESQPGDLPCASSSLYTCNRNNLQIPQFSISFTTLHFD